jgi:hypothetical protein
MINVVGCLIARCFPLREYVRPMDCENMVIEQKNGLLPLLLRA